MSLATNQLYLISAEIAADGLTLTKNNITHGGEDNELDSVQKGIAQSIFSQFEELEPSEEQFTLKEELPPLEKELKLDSDKPIVKKEETENKEIKQEAPNSGAVASKYLKIAQDNTENAPLPEGVESIKRFPEDEYGKTKVEIKLTNGQSVLINQFSEKAYRGPLHSDFQDKLEKMKESIEEQLINNKSTLSDPNLKVKLTKILSQTYDQAYRSLNTLKEENIKVNSYGIKEDINVRIEEGKKRFDVYFEGAEKTLAQFIRDVSFLSTEAGLKMSPQSIAKAEKEYIISHPRPTVINTYQIRNPRRYDQVRTFVSMQQPRSENGTTLPSTARDREGLGNYVLTSHGVVQNDGTVKINYEGIRHTSYPPIFIKDPKKRNEIAVKNVKQEVRDIAKDLILKKDLTPNSEDDPIVVPVRTMMLLTAKSIDFVRNKQYGVFGKWKGAGETLMLEESYRAMMAVDGKPFEIEIDGKNYWIKPDIKAMNLGINKAATSDKGGLIGKLPNGKIQDEVNNKGFNDFVTETTSHIESKMESLDVQIPYIQTDKSGKSKKIDYKQLAQTLKEKRHTEMCEFVSIVGDGINLYESGKHLKAKHITDFQTCFLIAHHMMGNPTTFFCKSAEDRTGNQNNRIEEYLVYREFYSQGSVLDKGAVEKGISPKVHMFSASQDNTYFNSFSRGLQIGGAVNKDYEELAESGKKMGCLAKEPFALAKEMKPSEEALKLAKELK